MLGFCCGEFDKPHAGINFQSKASFTSYFFPISLYFHLLEFFIPYYFLPWELIIDTTRCSCEFSLKQWKKFLPSPHPPPTRNKWTCRFPLTLNIQFNHWSAPVFCQANQLCIHYLRSLYTWKNSPPQFSIMYCCLWRAIFFFHDSTLQLQSSCNIT